MNSSSCPRSFAFPANLVSAKDFPTGVRSKSEVILRNHAPVETVCFDRLDSNGCSRFVASVWRSKFLDLADEAVARLAAGERLAMDMVEDSGAGELALFWWLGGEYATPVLVFTPQEPLPSGIAFRQWKQARVASVDGFRDNSLLRVFYNLWVAETNPELGHPSHRDILHRAVVDNEEEFVRDILGNIGRLEEGDISPSEITETPLGAAMENAGDLPDRLGFLHGCHRNFRQDDFCEAEDSETWVARARRIADLLKAAGAVDYSPLLTACREGDMPAVERMLDAGYPPNFAVYGHATALTNAVRGGHLEVCRLLIGRGANPNLPVPYLAEMVEGGETYPLQLALGDAELSALLMDSGADPSLGRDDEDCTPVVFTGGYGSEEAAEAIFGRCRFGEIRSRYGATGAHLLPTADLLLCRRWLTPEIVDFPDNTGMTPLVDAVRSLDIERVILLLEAGADPNRAAVVWEWNCWVGGFFSSIRWGSEIAFPLLLSPAQAALLSGDGLIFHTLLARGAQCEARTFRMDPAFDPDPAALALVRHQLAEDGGPEIGEALGSLPVSVGFSALWSPERTDSVRIIRRALQGGMSAEKYPGLVQEIDLLDAVRAGEASPRIREAFAAGRPLNARELLALADEQIPALDVGLKELSINIGSATDGTGIAELTRNIRLCRLVLDLARLRIAETEATCGAENPEVNRTTTRLFAALIAQERAGRSLSDWQRFVENAGKDVQSFKSAVGELRKRVRGR